jgi:hypothetical protein
MLVPVFDILEGFPICLVPHHKILFPVLILISLTQTDYRVQQGR